MTSPSPAAISKDRKTVETVTIRFAGDSGDGMQLVGGQFTNTTATLGNDLGVKKSSYSLAAMESTIPAPKKPLMAS